MKKLIICGMSLLLATGVMAQWGYHGRYYSGPRVSIGIGIPVSPFGYAPFYAYPPPLYAYPPLGYGFGYGYGYSPGYRYYNRPTKLDIQIEKIKNNYAHQISEVKHDKSIRRKERKKKIHELEQERDKAIIDAKKAYYEKPPRRHNFNTNTSTSI